MKRARIILADDQNLLLDALKAMLEPQFDVVGTFSDGHALVEAAPALKPDVVVLDVSMRTMNGLSAGQRLIRVIPGIKLIYITMNRDPDLEAEVFRLGALGYVMKNSAGSELVHAINEALVGRTYVTKLLTRGMQSSFIKNFKRRKKSRRSLTLRQKEVLQLLAEGRSMKEVAFILEVAPRTIAFHKYTIMDQLQLKNSAELIQFAIKSSIVPA